MATITQEVGMICSDAFAINSRIFDHKAVIKAECKFLVREFELKKNHEYTKSFLGMKISSEKVKQRIPECREMLEQNLDKLHSAVFLTASKAMDILTEERSNLAILKEELKIEREKNANSFFQEMELARDDVLKKHQILMDQLEI